FITGDWCDRYPDDVKQFFDAGHEIGTHSYQHPHVEGINVNELINDTKECSRKIKMLTGKEPTLYRAPYGEFDDSLITTLDGMGMKVIQWDVEGVDTDGKPQGKPLHVNKTGVGHCRPTPVFVISAPNTVSPLCDCPPLDIKSKKCYNI
ncbi:MAG: polysaccharide deacetylase family protein, partial [Oscillospiraceae bacterium]|nr:polysaccharide deacetylase family protein [Oscillospiraceae bacterium]